jgi:plasmid stabilization system protein ParE
MLLNLDLSDLAAEDLENMLSFSYSRFGYAQTQKYFQQFQNVILELRKAPEAPPSRLVTGIPDQVSYRRANSHYIFYQIRNNTLRVSRILHTSTDYLQHLEY